MEDYSNKLLHMLLGPVTRDDLMEVITEPQVEYMPLVMLLMEKGIITEEELDEASSKSAHIVDQMVAKNRHEAIKQFRRDAMNNPELAEIFIDDDIYDDEFDIDEETY